MFLIMISGTTVGSDMCKWGVVYEEVKKLEA